MALQDLTPILGRGAACCARDLEPFPQQRRSHRTPKGKAEKIWNRGSTQIPETEKRMGTRITRTKKKTKSEPRGARGEEKENMAVQGLAPILPIL